MAGPIELYFLEKLYMYVSYGGFRLISFQFVATSFHRSIKNKEIYNLKTEISGNKHTSLEKFSLKQRIVFKTKFSGLEANYSWSKAFI